MAKGSTTASDKTLAQGLVTTKPTVSGRTVTLPTGIKWKDVGGFAYYGQTPFRGIFFDPSRMTLTNYSVNTYTDFSVDTNSSSFTFPDYTNVDKPSVMLFYAIKP